MQICKEWSVHRTWLRSQDIPIDEMKEERQFQRTIRVHGFITKQRQLKSNALLRYFAKRQKLMNPKKVEAVQKPLNEKEAA